MGQADSVIENYKLNENSKTNSTQNEVKLRKFPTNYDFKSDENIESTNLNSGKTKNSIKQTFSSPAISNYKNVESFNGTMSNYKNKNSSTKSRKTSTENISKTISKEQSSNSITQQTTTTTTTSTTKAKNRTSSKYKKKISKSSSINGVELIVRKKLITTTTTTTLNPIENGLDNGHTNSDKNNNNEVFTYPDDKNNLNSAINEDNSVDGVNINQQQANPSTYDDAVASLIPDSLFTFDHNIIISASSDSASKNNLMCEDGEDLSNSNNKSNGIMDDINTRVSGAFVNNQKCGDSDMPNSPTGLTKTMHNTNLTSTIKKEQLEYEFRIKRIPRNRSSMRFLHRKSTKNSTKSQRSSINNNKNNKSYKLNNENNDDSMSDITYSNESLCYPFRIEFNKSLVRENKSNYRCVLFGIGCCPRSSLKEVKARNDNGRVIGSESDNETFSIKTNSKVVKNQPGKLNNKNRPENDNPYDYNSVGLFSYVLSSFLNKCCCCFFGYNNKCAHTKINQNDMDEIEKNSIYNRENCYGEANEFENENTNQSNYKHTYSSKSERDGVYMTTTTTDDVYMNSINNNLKGSTNELSNLGFTKRLINLFCCCCCCIINYFNVNSNGIDDGDEENNKSYLVRKRCCNSFVTGDRNLNVNNHNSDDDYEIRNDDKNLSKQSQHHVSSKSTKKKTQIKHSDSDILDPPPITCIRVLRPSNDLTPVRFDSHYNIIQALNNNGNSLSEDGDPSVQPNEENNENYSGGYWN